MSNHTTAEKAAQEIVKLHVSDVDNLFELRHGQEIYNEAVNRAAGIIKVHIDEATAEQQARIDALVQALGEARCCLVMEGYGSSRGRRHHAVLDQIEAALEPPKEPKRGDANAQG
jgi:hypothetical protein